MAAMEMSLTVAALVAGLALMGAMSLLERRPRQNLNPRLLPTTPFMFAGALVALLAAVHLLTVFGIELPKR
jgi:uncharacterized membrane protein